MRVDGAQQLDVVILAGAPHKRAYKQAADGAAGKADAHEPRPTRQVDPVLVPNEEPNKQVVGWVGPRAAHCTQS